MKQKGNKSSIEYIPCTLCIGAASHAWWLTQPADMRSDTCKYYTCTSDDLVVCVSRKHMAWSGQGQWMWLLWLRKRHSFVMFMGCAEQLEAHFSEFSSISTYLLRLQVAQMPRCWDLAILIPLAYVHRVISSYLINHYTVYSKWEMLWWLYYSGTSEPLWDPR